MDTNKKKCSRCHTVKCIDLFVGLRGMVKTCHPCRIPTSGKKRPNDLNALYSRNFRKNNPDYYKGRVNTEYNRAYYLKKKAEKEKEKIELLEYITIYFI
jgi:hypothetical protein